MTIELSEYVIDAIANAVVKKMQEPCEDCISRQAVLDMVEDMTDQFGNKHRVVTEGMISLLPSVTPKPKTDVLDKIRAEIDNALSDGMIHKKTVLGIIDKYKKEGE